MSKEGDHDKSILDGGSWNSDGSGGVEEDPSKNFPETRQMEADMEETPPPANGDKRRAADEGSGSEQKGEEKGVGGGDLDHETHTWTERGRRKKMRDMFASLHDLLPQLPPKVDKSTIVEEAVKQIRILEETLHILQKRKHEKLHRLITPRVNNDPGMNSTQQLATNSREAFLADQGSSQKFSFPKNIPPVFRTWKFPNVILNICGRDAHICICCPKKVGLLSAICYVLEKYKLEVVSAQVSSDSHRSMCMIHARANEVSDQAQNAFPVEEIFKQAAGEITVFVNSK